MANDLMRESLVCEEDAVIGMSPLKQEVGFLRVARMRDRMVHFIIFLQQNISDGNSTSEVQAV